MKNEVADEKNILSIVLIILIVSTTMGCVRGSSGSDIYSGFGSASEGKSEDITDYGPSNDVVFSDASNTKKENYDCFDELNELPLQNVTLVNRYKIKNKISEGRKHRINMSAPLKVQIDNIVLTLAEDTMKDVCDIFSKFEEYELDSVDLSENRASAYDVSVKKQGETICLMRFRPHKNTEQLGDFYLEEVSALNAKPYDKIWFQGGFNILGNGLTTKDLEDRLSEIGIQTFDRPKGTDYINHSVGLMKSDENSCYYLSAYRYEYKEGLTNKNLFYEYPVATYTFRFDKETSVITSVELVGHPASDEKSDSILGGYDKTGDGYGAIFVLYEDGNPLIESDEWKEVSLDVPNSSLRSEEKRYWIDYFEDTRPPFYDAHGNNITGGGEGNLGEIGTFERFMIFERGSDGKCEATLYDYVCFDIEEINKSKPGDQLTTKNSSDGKLFKIVDLEGAAEEWGEYASDIREDPYYANVAVEIDGRGWLLGRGVDVYYAEIPYSEEHTYYNPRPYEFCLDDEIQVVLDNMLPYGGEKTITGAEFIEIPNNTPGNLDMKRALYNYDGLKVLMPEKEIKATVIFEDGVLTKIIPWTNSNFVS